MLGIGTVEKRCAIDGIESVATFNKVLFAPDLGVNLISVTQLLDSGANTTIDRHRLRIHKGGV